MGEKDAAAAQDGNGGILEKRCADLARIEATHHEVAVAVHDVKGVGGGIGAQGFGDVRHRVGGVVAHPVVEEVAENQQLGMLGRLVFEKALEGVDRVGLGIVQMEVRDEDRIVERDGAGGRGLTLNRGDTI